MNNQSLLEKKWRDSTFKDNFIFSKTLELYPDLCKKTIEMILNIEIEHIEFPEREKVIESRTDVKVFVSMSTLKTIKIVSLI